MTPQEIFDKTYTAVINQGFRCYNEAMSQCMYETTVNEQKAHCAVGFLLKECVDKEDIDNDIFDSEEGILDLIYNEQYNLPSWFYENRLLLDRIQTAHDRASDENFVDSFKQRMGVVALDSQLKVPDPIEVK